MSTVLYGKRENTGERLSFFRGHDILFAQTAGDPAKTVFGRDSDGRTASDEL